MPGMFQDLRHGLRALASHPGSTIAAVLSLGLAIGAQTSIYCLIDALFLRSSVGVTEALSLRSSSDAPATTPAKRSLRRPVLLALSR